MLKTLLFTLIIVAISMAFFAIKILFKKNGRFPNTHVGHSAAMRKRGITCVQTMDALQDWIRRTEKLAGRGDLTRKS